MSDRPSDTDFTPISPNPFIVGNPVRDRTMFFGREAEFELVRRRFQDSNQGGLLVFCGERRSGKTSILFQILDRRLGPDFIPVLIDMQSMAVASEIDFLTKISMEVLQALGAEAAGIAPPKFATGSSHSATFQAFIQDVLRAHPRKKLILLFDEYELFENKIDSGTLAADVLHILANLVEHHSVFIVFTGSQHLEQRRREYWKILGRSIYKQISYLERDDALNLIQKPVEGRVRYGERAVETIYRLTAGQPFYTQAICQSLVDHLNEERTEHATREKVSEVVEGLVNNPLPQMIFMWDALERDEKLILALLAESLPDDIAHATADQVVRIIRQREYPLQLSKARIATMLEKLFKSEMLLRSDQTTPPGFAFRMDLWRLWVRRMHSVWQVMREEGLEIRHSGLGRLSMAMGRLSIAWRIALGGAVVLGALAAAIGIRSRQPSPFPPPPSGTSVAPFVLEPEPIDALIHLDGRLMGMGTFRDAITTGQDHVFRVTAPGYADSQLPVKIAVGDSGSQRVRLRPLLGGFRIETQPPGAEVSVDGQPRGRSPVNVTGLEVAKPHVVTAALSGYGTAQDHFSTHPDSLVPVTLALAVGRVNLTLITEPSGAELFVDGSARGRSPLQLPGTTLGKHSVKAMLKGHIPTETTIDVTEGIAPIHLTLRREPPGILVVQGDQPALIYLDGNLIIGNVQNSGPRELIGGPHQVRVELASGETIDHTVMVKSGERAIYDYSKRTVKWQPLGGN